MFRKINSNGVEDAWEEMRGPVGEVAILWEQTEWPIFERHVERVDFLRWFSK